MVEYGDMSTGGGSVGFVLLCVILLGLGLTSDRYKLGRYMVQTGKNMYTSQRCASWCNLMSIYVMYPKDEI